MNLEQLDRRLTEALEGPLPGLAAQLCMAPSPRPGWRPGMVPVSARPAGAMILLYPRAGEPCLVLTVRPGDLPNHAGQVSLPGGAVEPGETPDQAALRELDEEVRIAPANVRLLGALTPLYIPVSCFVLHPFVGLLAETPDLRPCDREVERALEVPLRVLLDPDRVASEVRRHHDLTF
ncbi:MAG: CoA pyrophosphatase, partial [Acidobacteriota bacterium]